MGSKILLIAVVAVVISGQARGDASPMAEAEPHTHQRRNGGEHNQDRGQAWDENKQNQGHRQHEFRDGRPTEGKHHVTQANYQGHLHEFQDGPKEYFLRKDDPNKIAELLARERPSRVIVYPSHFDRRPDDGDYRNKDDDEYKNRIFRRGPSDSRDRSTSSDISNADDGNDQGDQARSTSSRAGDNTSNSVAIASSDSSGSSDDNSNSAAAVASSSSGSNDDSSSSSAVASASESSDDNSSSASAAATSFSNSGSSDSRTATAPPSSYEDDDSDESDEDFEPESNANRPTSTDSPSSNSQSSNALQPVDNDNKWLSDLIKSIETMSGGNFSLSPKWTGLLKDFLPLIPVIFIALGAQIVSLANYWPAIIQWFSSQWGQLMNNSKYKDTVAAIAAVVITLGYLINTHCGFLWKWVPDWVVKQIPFAKFAKNLYKYLPIAEIVELLNRYK